MTDQELELQLRAWYRAEVGSDEVAPTALRSSILAIPQDVRRPLFEMPNLRTSGRLAIAAILAAALLAALLLGFPGTTPHPRPSQSPSPASTGAVSSNDQMPTPTAVPTLIAIYQRSGTTAQISTLDFATRALTSVRAVDVSASNPDYSSSARVEWSTDRRTISVFDVTDSSSLLVQIHVDDKVVHTPPVPMTLVSPSGEVAARLEDKLVVLDLQGNTLREIDLPFTGARSDVEAWSPDGTTVIVSACGPCDLAGKGPDTSNHVHLFLIPVAGGTAWQFGDVVTTGGLFADAQWSPDMTSVAASVNGVGTFAIDSASGAQRRLDSNASDAQPVWSPDGRQVAFVRAIAKGGGIFVANVSAGSVRRLTTAANYLGDRLPVWSPDGSWILFRRGPVGGYLGDLWMIPSAGGTPELLLKNAAADW